MANNRFYQTADMAFAAYLMCKGCALRGLQAGEGRRFSFAFELSDQQQYEFDAAFMSGNATVEPSRYFMMVKKLKAELRTAFEKLDRK